MRGLDLNQGPSGYEPDELPDCSTPRLIKTCYITIKILSKSNVKNILLITGGAGFIGSNLIEFLVSKTKFDIISYDNYSTGSTANHILSKRVKYLKGHTKNIEKVIKEIPKENYKNILKGAYERQDYYIKKTSKTKKYKNYKN